MFNSGQSRITIRQNLSFKLAAITITILVCCINKKVNAQTPAPPLDSYVSFSGGQGSVFLILPDTIGCSEIEVNLGSKTETDDLFTHAYVYDQESGLPSGLSYIRTGSDVIVGIGTVEVPPAFNVKIRLKNSSGNWSSWYEYITN